MARIVELDVPVDNVSGYAVFDGGVLRRAVFINLDAWLSSMEAAGDTRGALQGLYGGIWWTPQEPTARDGCQDALLPLSGKLC